MIPYTSCMCFGAERGSVRRRPWRLVSAQKGTTLVVARDEDNSFCIQIRDEESIKTEENTEAKDTSRINSALSISEECILTAALAEQRSNPMSSGEEEVRLVPGRRSRHPVITRVVHLNLLDDTYAGVTQVLLSKCGSWSFNTFNLDVSTGGRSLSYLLVHLFHEYGFVKCFGLDVVKVWHCFNLMESAYHRHNPYHNSVHAADVTQAMHCFLQENKFSAHLTPLEAMSAVIAAVAHDLDHPGVTQAFLVATSNHLVNLYHNSSVLENHHWRTAISCLSESRIFDHLDREIWLDIQGKIRSLILATDITRQKEFLAKFKNYLHSESLDMEQEQYRHFALQIALKCADLCNPCRPWSISQRWSYQVCQEFYRQGAYERQLKLPLTPTFDCSRTKVAKIQADFFQFVVSPLFETWDHFLKTPLSSRLLRNLRHNYCQWQSRMEAIQRATDAECLLADKETPQIHVDPCSLSFDNLPSPSEGLKEAELLSVDSDIVLKQHRSKSDSGLSPQMLSPRIHMDTYSTEELHPSTTLLSLSSITNTVQLRKVYATTKVESHLICPTVFQPVLLSDVSLKLPSSPTSDSENCLSDRLRNENSPTEHETAQSLTMPSCSDGCCSPSTPEKPTFVHISRSLVIDSEAPESYSQIASRRRASDYSSRITDKHLISRCQSQTLVPRSNRPYSTAPSKDSLNSRMLRKDKSDIRLALIDKSSNQYDDTTGLSRKEKCSDGNYINSPETADSSQITPSWCWHISRSFSAERPQRPTHDFDSPLPPLPMSTMHGGLTCHGHGARRASAPVAVTFAVDVGGSKLSGLGDIDAKGGLRGGAQVDSTSGRRWSIPMETITGMQLGNTAVDTPENSCSSEEIYRRHSLGQLEPVLSTSALETESEVTPNSSDVKQKPNHSSCNMFMSAEIPEVELNEHLDTKIVSSCDTFLPCFSPSHPATVPRRGSLPAEVPIALMCHVASPSRHLPKPIRPEQFSSSKESGRSPCTRSGHLWEHSKRHGSPTDLLSVLIGPTGMLNTMHGIVSGRTSREWPYTASRDNSRRRSGGLEMLSGLWRSRTSETPIGIGMAAKIKLQRQLLEDWASWRKGEESHVSAGTSISALSQQLVYQQRRGSVPLNASLLSLSSGNTCSGEHMD